MVAGVGAGIAGIGRIARIQPGRAGSPGSIPGRSGATGATYLKVSVEASMVVIVSAPPLIA